MIPWDMSVELIEPRVFVVEQIGKIKDIKERYERDGVGTAADWDAINKAISLLDSAVDTLKGLKVEV